MSISFWTRAQAALQATHRLDDKLLKQALTADDLCGLIRDNLAIAEYKLSPELGNDVKQELKAHLKGCKDCGKNYGDLQGLSMALSFYNDNELKKGDARQLEQHMGGCEGCKDQLREYKSVAKLSRAAIGDRNPHRRRPYGM